MKFDDKVDLILQKLNGSEGSDLATDIQAWLAEHSDAVDNQLIIDELSDKELIKFKIGSTKLSVITAKGRRVNDKGGYLKFRKRNDLKKVLAKVISYGNLSFAAINVAVLLYSCNQNNRLEREVDRSALVLDEQHKLIQQSRYTLDSIREELNVQEAKLDSVSRKLGPK